MPSEDMSHPQQRTAVANITNFAGCNLKSYEADERIDILHEIDLQLIRSGSECHAATEGCLNEDRQTGGRET